MQQVPYKGYLIKPVSLQIRDSGRWSMEVYILKHRGDSVAQRQFAASDTFVTEEDAIQHCVNFGKQVIDGKHEMLTVSDL